MIYYGNWLHRKSWSIRQPGPFFGKVTGQRRSSPLKVGGLDWCDHYHCWAQADIPSVIARYDKETLLRVLTADPRAMLRYAALLSRQLRDLRMRLELRSIRTAEDRVKQYLQLAADPANGRVKESGTFKDLAVRLGLAHETLYRVLASLERQGIIGRDAVGIILNMGERP